MFAPWRRLALSATVGFVVSSPLLAQEPARLTGEPAAGVSVSHNQTVADAAAARLRADGRLRQYSVDVAVTDGTADVVGTVRDAGQRDIVLGIVRGVPGITDVRDRLTTRTNPIVPVQAVELPPPTATPTPVPGAPMPPAGAAPGGQMLPGLPPGGMPPAGPYGPVGNDPMPVGGIAGGGQFDQTPPLMPPYSWPTYAPYNNYSRVAYPELYPYNAWPFIGPVYPFPKVPLGWRSVKLEWEDNHWWFSKTATPHDWWRIRYH